VTIVTAEDAGFAMKLLAGLIVALVLVGCGGSDGSDQPVSAGTPVDAQDTIESRGELAGTLVISPAEATAGRSVGVAVENTGDGEMEYGLGNTIKRRVGGRWKDVTRRVYGGGQVVPDIALLARPGERAGPRYNEDIRDRIRLPRKLRPGTYRVLKKVRGRGPDPSLKLDGVFQITGVTAGCEGIETRSGRRRHAVGVEKFGLLALNLSLAHEKRNGDVSAKDRRGGRCPHAGHAPRHGR
jgi:hypothetical protein